MKFAAPGAASIDDAPAEPPSEVQQVLPVTARATDEDAVARPDHGRCPSPAYPTLLREQGIEGVVTVRVRVEASGDASDVELLRPSGWRLFDEAAIRQVRSCRFVPARRAGEPLASWVEFPIRFTLAG